MERLSYPHAGGPQGCGRERRNVAHMAEWEYHAEQLPDKQEGLEQSMRLWSEAGWELVTVTSATAPARIGSSQIWQTRHTLFWRRRRRPAPASAA